MEARKEKILLSYIAGVRAGTLSQDEHGLHSFVYDGTYDGPPLSLAMPIANKTYRGRIVDAYLLGLLPVVVASRRSTMLPWDCHTTRLGTVPCVWRCR